MKWTADDDDYSGYVRCCVLKNFCKFFCCVLLSLFILIFFLHSLVIYVANELCILLYTVLCNHSSVSFLYVSRCFM